MEQRIGTGQQVDRRASRALGLPAGSIRALLAVMIFATLWGGLVLRPTQDVPDYLSDLLFVIMGHYFAVRGAGQDPRAEAGPSPLFLPRGSIRFVLVAGWLAVAVVLYRRGQLAAPDRNPGAVTLMLVGGFLLGVALNALTTWWRARRGHAHRLVEDTQALVAMTAAVVLVALVWNRWFHVFPADRLDLAFARRVRLGRYGLEHALSAVVGFYFGSRS